jgi:hypothetical protein
VLKYCSAIQHSIIMLTVLSRLWSSATCVLSASKRGAVLIVLSVLLHAIYICAGCGLDIVALTAV